MSVEGQIEGAAVQSIGASLWEALEYDPDGRPLNANLLDYRMPTSVDVPSIETILIGAAGGDGSIGAKGVGEPPAIPLHRPSPTQSPMPRDEGPRSR